MTARFRDFGSDSVLDTSQYEPVQFKLDGETFNCYSALPGAVLLTFVSDADSNQGGRQAESVFGLFSAVMPPDEYERFQAFIKRPNRVVPVEVLVEISIWLTEVYAARPTPLPSDSASGTGTTPPSSEAPASSEESILTS